jgi:predicted acylesterase/phospholipase RssA
MGVRRAITLAGGGPAAGLHIGVLKALEENKIEFDVWALSCIGAWVGIIYNKFDKNNAAQTEAFFRDNIFRLDESYLRFPVNSVFGTDWAKMCKALARFIYNIDTYDKLVLPSEMVKLGLQSWFNAFDQRTWNEGDINKTMLELFAVNPLVRYFTSMIWLSDVSGLARINYPDSSFAASLGIDKLRQDGKPFIYHNAWNITQRKLQLFANFPERYPGSYSQLTSESLCACSALPFIEETVAIEGNTFCEGALVDTVNFEDLLDDHYPLDEIWICRIVDTQQVRAPRNLHDALGNLCMLFAAALGEDDVKLFKWHAKARGWPGRIVEIKVSADINFEWTHTNLRRGIKNGYEAAREAMNNYNLEEALAALLRREEERRADGCCRRADNRMLGLHMLVDKARENAFEDLVQHWIHSGAKEITPEHLRKALAPEILGNIARRTRVAPQEILYSLADKLPKLLRDIEEQR